MKKLGFFIKIIVLIIIASIYNAIMQFVSPIIANELAMNQMQNSVDSSLGIQLYTYASNYSWIVFLLVVVIMFYKDALKLIKWIKEKNKDEEK